MDWPILSLTEWLVLAIVVLLLFISARLDNIYNKLTEKDRENDIKLKAIHKKTNVRNEAWSKLSEVDQARFNDFHYEHAVGEISDEDYARMKRELHDKTDGKLD